MHAGGDGAAEAEDEQRVARSPAGDGTPPLRGDANGGARVFLFESAVTRVDRRVHDAVDAKDADVIVVLGDLDSVLGVDATSLVASPVSRARRGGSGKRVEVARVEPVGNLEWVVHALEVGVEALLDASAVRTHGGGAVEDGVREGGAEDTDERTTEVSPPHRVRKQQVVGEERDGQDHPHHARESALRRRDAEFRAAERRLHALALLGVPGVRQLRVRPGGRRVRPTLHVAKSNNDNSKRDEGRDVTERATARSRAETIAETRDDARHDALARRIEWRVAA